ncbi:MAG TPA: hypothetical protein VMR50_13490 [Myxococcota bacterium]|nr:hypothetical protein [Myxococcota bacterium]
MKGWMLAMTALLGTSPLAWAGDEFRTPTLRPASSYELFDPRYRMVGIEDDGERHTVFAIAHHEDVETTKTVQRIVRDVRRRCPGFTEIEFYTTFQIQHGDPRSPSFAIYDHLARYDSKENKTYYGVAAKKLYGGWAAGPPGPVERVPPGRLCVQRDEDNGSMNVFPVRILAGRGGHFHDVVFITGGESDCVPLEPGDWSIRARSFRPYDPTAKDPDECRSETVRVKMAEGEIQLSVSPTTTGPTYQCGWDLRRVSR